MHANYIGKDQQRKCFATRKQYGVVNIINGLKDSPATGWDNISSRFLKNTSENTSLFLANISSQSHGVPAD